MKKILFLISFCVSLSMADSVLLVKKGWQLIGSSTALSNMSKFTNDNVEQVWHFDAFSQSWFGFSPDATTQEKMKSNNITTLTKLKNWHGFWIKSKKDWSLTFKSTSLTSAPNTTQSADIIELKRGWNLISLPVDSVVSADIFKEMTVWKYNSQNKWELSDDSFSKEEFPQLGHIKNSDGIWVKAEKDINVSVLKEASKLHNFANKKAMESYIKEMAVLYKRPYCGIEPFTLNMVDAFPIMEGAVNDEASVTSASGVRNTSNTNLQEHDVDESDILKHNEKYVFYMGSKEGRKEHINVTSFENLANKQEKLTSITFDDKREINSFYLLDNRLVVLSSLYAFYDIDVAGSAVDPERVLVDIFDVSNIKEIKKVATYKVDGSISNSRVVNDNLYLISSFSPRYSIRYPKEYLIPSDECKALLLGEVIPVESEFNKYADCYNIVVEDGRYFRFDYDKPIVKILDLLPEIEGTALSSQSLIEPKSLYASAKAKQEASMTSISKFSISKASYTKSISYVGSSSIQYASSKALYLLANNYPFYYDFSNYKEQSTLYKFSFDDDLSYKAVGKVSGTAMNQFALSEYKDILRIATTEGFSWRSEKTKNSLFTLKEKDALLEIEGVLSGLGKEGETIKSVRFMGDRAYLVTFKTSDPLYTLDLSNPKVPKKVGELEISGYSAYLHPIGENKLLGIGRDTDSEGNRLGVKIELFDVSDFENPSSLDTLILANGTSSELEYNHKALAFRNSDNLFAFPYTQYINGFVDSFTQNHLGIYQIKEDGLKSYNSIESDSEKWGEHRGLIFDYNSSTYISFFSNDEVLSTVLTEKE